VGDTHDVLVIGAGPAGAFQASRACADQTVAPEATFVTAAGTMVLTDAMAVGRNERGLVYRYLAHDGLAGEERTFLLCTFWLAQAQALAGEVDQATATFERTPGERADP